MHITLNLTITSPDNLREYLAILQGANLPIAIASPNVASVTLPQAKTPGLSEAESVEFAELNPTIGKNRRADKAFTAACKAQGMQGARIRLEFLRALRDGTAQGESDDLPEDQGVEFTPHDDGQEFL